MNHHYQDDIFALFAPEEALTPPQEVGATTPTVMRRQNQEDSDSTWDQEQRRRDASAATVAMLLDVLTANPRLREQLQEAIRAHMADLQKRFGQ